LKQKGKRKSYSAEFKAKVAIEAIKENKTRSELSSKYQVHSTQITKWKQDAIEGIKETFRTGSHSREDKEKDNLIEELYKQIGKQKVELDWLKKKVDPFC
jgi:transposase